MERQMMTNGRSRKLGPAVTLGTTALFAVFVVLYARPSTDPELFGLFYVVGPPVVTAGLVAGTWLTPALTVSRRWMAGVQIFLGVVCWATGYDFWRSPDAQIGSGFLFDVAAATGFIVALYACGLAIQSLLLARKTPAL